MTADGGPQPQDRVPQRPGTSDPSDARMPVIRPDGVIETPAPLSGKLVRRVETNSTLATVPAESSLTAVLGDCRREGVWRVGRTTTVYSVMGDIVLDLRQAVIEDEMIDIHAYTVMGDLKVIVPPGFEVHLRGFSLLGDRTHKDLSESGAAVAQRRTVVISGTGVMGDVRVTTMDVGQDEPKWWKRKGLPESRRLPLGWRPGR